MLLNTYMMYVIGVAVLWAIVGLFWYTKITEKDGARVFDPWVIIRSGPLIWAGLGSFFVFFIGALLYQRIRKRAHDRTLPK